MSNKKTQNKQSTCSSYPTGQSVEEQAITRAKVFEKPGERAFLVFGLVFGHFCHTLLELVNS